MTEKLKDKMRQPCKSRGQHDIGVSEEECMSCSSQHIKEFGSCIGKVIDFDLSGDVEVRWIPSNLRYTYLKEYLQICNLKAFI